MRPALVSGPPNRKKPHNKHLISLVFSVRTVNYGFSFFSIDLWPTRFVLETYMAIFKTGNGELGNRGIGESGNRGIGERGTGNGEWGMGNRGIGERGIGERGKGNGERGTGNGESLK